MLRASNDWCESIQDIVFLEKKNKLSVSYGLNIIMNVLYLLLLLDHSDYICHF